MALYITACEKTSTTVSLFTKVQEFKLKLEDELQSCSYSTIPSLWASARA